MNTVTQELKPAGVFGFKHFRDGKLIYEDSCSPNIVVTEGKNYIADVAYNNNDTIKPTWYTALFVNNRTPLAGDNAATVAGLTTELTTQYSEPVRQTWTPNAGNTGASSSNSDSAAVFTITASATLYGAFMISENTKAGTSGVLLAEALFDGGARAVQNADVVHLTYTIQLV